LTGRPLSRSSFLTERQVQVLKMRIAGCSQEEIARQLGTTRANVAILEKRARQNIERARTTVQIWKEIQAPVAVVLPAGTDLFEIPARIFQEADARGVRIPLTSVDLVVQLREKAPHLFHKRVLERSTEVRVTLQGEVLVN